MPEDSSLLGEKILGLLPKQKKKINSATKPSVSGALYLFQLALTNSLPRLVLIAILAALCGTGVLFLLNMEAKAVEAHNYDVMVAVLFALMLIMYRASQNYLVKTVSREVEEALDRQRQRVVAKALTISLRDVEEIGRNRIRDGMAEHYVSLSQCIVPVIAGAESLILLICLFAYVLYLSVFAAVTSVVVVSLLIGGWLNHHRKSILQVREAEEANAQYRRLTDAIVGGAKELQLNTARRSGLKRVMNDVSKAVANGRIQTAAHISEMMATGLTTAYLMAGAVVFLMPVLITDTSNTDMSRIVIAIIFLLGPIGNTLQTIQQITIAQHAMESINSFEAEITDRAQTFTNKNSTNKNDLTPPIFENIKLDSVGYIHRGNDAFAIDNIILEIKKGDIVFLTGGNGSGKTTLLNVLTGLYPRASGEISLNEREQPTILPQQYKDLFASVFSDFYIFDRPYGFDEKGLDLFDYWLRKLKVRDKFSDSIEDLGSVDLSTGQRKRVALALAIAEQRSILVLDEWAADQDPDTRKVFYEEIIPELKESGITVFAITHDERYFHCCDQRLHLIEGRLSEEIVC